MQPVRPVTLADDFVSLEPLALEHTSPLLTAASGPRDTYSLTRVPKDADEVRAYIELALADQARGVSLPFVTRDVRGGAIVGSTRFMSMERWSWGAPHEANGRPADHVDVVEIGATWLAASAQRTAVNTHQKRLMLTHAFEVWDVRRVMLKTDARNARSRTAILRIGATFDGVLRAHMAGFDGKVRDTAFFSILASEWPDVKARLGK